MSSGGTGFDLCPFTQAIQDSFDECVNPFGFRLEAPFECTYERFVGTYTKLLPSSERQLVRVWATTHPRADVDELQVSLFLNGSGFGVRLQEFVLHKAPERQAASLDAFRAYHREHVGKDLPKRVRKVPDWLDYVLLGPESVHATARQAASDLHTYARSFLTGDLQEFRILRRDVCRRHQHYWKGVRRTLDFIRRKYPHRWKSSDDAQLEAYEEWRRIAEL